MKKYTEQHEWIELKDDIATVGITDYAQCQLGDVVYVELPEIGILLDKEGQAAVVESVKAASEVYSPISGEVIEVNKQLSLQPALVNTHSESNGWFFKLKITNVKELDSLMNEEEYKKFVH